MLRKLGKYFQYIIPGLFLLVVILATVSVFSNFNKTLEQAEQVFLLQHEVAPAQINERLWQQVVARLKEKDSSSLFSDIKDPF